MQALRASVIANPTLTWENTLTYNAGLTLRCGMVCWELEFDAFYNYTYDILTAMGGDYRHLWEDIIILMPTIIRWIAKALK